MSSSKSSIWILERCVSVVVPVVLWEGEQKKMGLCPAALQVLCSLGVRHGGSSVQCSSVTAHAPAGSLVGTKIHFGNQPCRVGAGIFRAAVGVSARCRQHSWGLTPLCRYGHQEGSWKSCPLPPLGNRWKLSG